MEVSKMYERKYIAVSIKHTEHGWKFGMRCTMWGFRRTGDGEERCFGGYTENINTAELYSIEEFTRYYGSDICKHEPVKMCIDFCKKYKEFDTVLVSEENMRTYYRACGFEE